MSITVLPKYITNKQQALRDAGTTRDKNYQSLTDVVQACRQQKKDTEMQSLEAESQWRSLFRKLRGEMTPELQAQHHSRISKRELAKEFDGLIEVMVLDKNVASLKLRRHGPEGAERAQRRPHGLCCPCDASVDAQSKVLISPDVIKTCALASRAYDVYADNPMKIIEQQVLGTLQGRIHVAMAQQNIDHPVLNEIDLTIPQETGALLELQRSPAKRMQVISELKEKRQRLQ
ncbi:NAD-dependent aldehyde dehydrogenase [Serratia bockelmannii]|uniref:NAD-dependent aldehyde dehydrogenase n=1 Tax=Serratia bockelmannii TaxID=2703793 RepID=UPI002361A044|nr:NAD-dependent aldehyde dehydrogenase [Serratia bockelmannii]